MKIFHLLISSFFLLLSSCSQFQDEPFDESVLSELPSFEYLGYTYYVHPRLSVLYSYVEYKDIEKSVQSLDSYSYQTWFIPTMDELEQAARKGFLQKNFDAYEEFFYISSSKSAGKYQCLTYGYGWFPCDLNSYNGYYTVRPMIKFRKKKS